MPFTYETVYWQLAVPYANNISTQGFFAQCGPGNSAGVFPPAIGIWTLIGPSIPSFNWYFYPLLGWYVYQPVNPNPLLFESFSAPSDPNGWYLSPSSFYGNVSVIAGGRPVDGRTWGDIATWAVNGTAPLGGSPAASCTFDNKIVYPATGYSPSYPTIRMFDGLFDRQLCQLPAAESNTPVAILSMLAANDTIYLSTFDSGTSSTTWLGRVFSLNIDSGQLIPVAPMAYWSVSNPMTPTGTPTAFAYGEMPYALAWHNNKLWLGTNNGIGTVGNVYYIDPSVDEYWTQDYTLITSSAGGVDSMQSYNGYLYVGTDNAAASRGLVLQRDANGVYTTVDTGTGGAAQVNNGYLSMIVFNGDLYTAYFNNDSPLISHIRKFDGTSWTTAYTGVSTSLLPFITMFQDSGYLYVIGGAGEGLSLSGCVVNTPDGTTWTDQTANLPAFSGETLTSVVGVVIQ